jgi:hypothetical protein
VPVVVTLSYNVSLFFTVVIYTRKMFMRLTAEHGHVGYQNQNNPGCLTGLAECLKSHRLINSPTTLRIMTLSIMILDIMKFRIMVLSIMTLKIIILNTVTLNIMSFSIMALGIMTLNMMTSA